MRICVGATLQCAGASDRIAAEDEYIRSHGGDLELMRLIREQARGAPPLRIVFAPDPGAAEMQAQHMKAAAERFDAQLQETQGLVQRTCQEAIGGLPETPGDVEPLHAAAKVGSPRTFLQLAARGYRLDANASHRQSDVALERILRGVADALDSGELERLEKIARVAEPRPRDMHATPGSDMRVGQLRAMHALLCEGLAKLWGAIAVDDLIARKQAIAHQVGLPRENAERGAREEMATFSPDRAHGSLARTFVEAVALIPEVFTDRGVEFSTATQYTPEGAIDGRPDPKRLALVEAAYKQRIDNWQATCDAAEISDRAKLLIESGLKALGMKHPAARSVVSMFRQQADRSARRQADQ